MTPLKPYLHLQWQNFLLCGLTVYTPTCRGKTLRIGVLGFKPYVTMDRRDELGRPDGTDMRLLRLLEDKMGFTAEINFITSFRGVVEEVGSYTESVSNDNCNEVT